MSVYNFLFIKIIILRKSLVSKFLKDENHHYDKGLLLLRFKRRSKILTRSLFCLVTKSFSVKGTM